MKKSKKQSWIKRNYGLCFFILVVVTIVAGYILLIYQNSISYICSKNSDKCVCEEEISFCKQKGSHLSRAYSEDYELECCDKKGLCYRPTDFKCSKLRLKTQAELDIQSCQENPREDDLCKCEVWDEPLYNYSSIKLKSGEVIKFTATMCSGEDLEASRTNGYEIEFVNATKCLESRPKTDYEKHPEDYVAETQSKIETFCRVYGWDIKGYYHKGEINYNTFVLENGSIFCGEQTYNETFGYFEVIKNQTTYRLKTERLKAECEKGNPDYVEETEILEYSCTSKYKTIIAIYNNIGSYSETWNKNLHIYYCDSDFETKCFWMDCSDENAGKISCMKELFESDKRIEENDFYNGICQVTQKSICREETLEEKQFEEVCKQTINYKVKD